MRTIRTERLVLEPLGPDYAGFMLKLLNDPGFIENIADRGVRTVEESRDYIASRFLAQRERVGFDSWIVHDRDGAPVGMCGLIVREGLDAPDLGFAFMPEGRGKGYARESAAAVLDHARAAHGVTRVLGFTNPANVASQAVLKAVGMTFEGVIELPNVEGPVHLFGWDGSSAGMGEKSAWPSPSC